jgi:PAS domain S-box-containing protein
MTRETTRTEPARRIWAVVFGLIAAVILISGYLYYGMEAEHIRLEKYGDIATIAEMKSGQIAQWRKERLADAWRAANGPTVIKNLTEILKNPDAPGLRAELQKILEVNRKSDLYASVLLVSPDGKPILAAGDDPTPSDDPDIRKIIQEALASREAVLSGFSRRPRGGLYLDAAAAVRNADGQPMAVMLLRNRADAHLYPLVQSWPTQSRSAETMLVERQGGDVVILNELRHRSGTALAMCIPVNHPGPAARAAIGTHGLFQGPDYRDVEVLADLRPIPGSPWFIVAKVDTAEILAEVRYRAKTIAGLAVLSLLLLTALTALAYRQQQAGFFLGIRLTEHKTRDAKEVFRTILYSIGDGVITTDTGGRVRQLNKVAEQLTGWPEAEAEGRPLDEVFRIVHEGTRAPAENPVQRVLRDGLVVGLANHTLLIDRNGAERPIADSAAPIRIEGDAITGVVLVFRDQTEERAAQHALQESEERFRMMVEGVTDYAILMLDPAGLVVNWNAGAERLKGYRADEIVGHSFSRFYPEAERAAGQPMKNLEIATAEGCLETEGWRLRKDGSRFWASVVITALRDDKGRLRGFCKITRDITERKRAEDTLRTLNTQLEQRVEERTRELVLAKESAEAANRAKSEFLANVSHEVRTPMNAIMGMTDLVLETPLSPEQKRYLLTVRESADSLLGVLNDILDFAKIESGRLDLEEMPFALRDVVEGTASALAERAHHKGLELACHLASEAPEMLVGDPGRLRQILVNLIGNAIKFTTAGEVVVRVAVESAHEQDVVLHVSVADTGIGIPPEKQRVIFEPFRQADASVTRKFGGTGLGLAISAQLTARMQGRMWVESQPEKGSVFHFTARFKSALGLPSQTPASPAELVGMRVLIVDDNATNRLIYTEVIGSWNMRPMAVEEAGQALDALAQARAAGVPFSLVLLDRQMPGLDAYAFAARVRGTPDLASLKIIMLSSTGDLGDAERRRELEIAACLVKPVRQSELLNTILRVMGFAAGAPQTAAEAPALRPLKVLLAEDYPMNQELAVQILGKRGHAVAVVENGQDALRRLEDEDFDVVLMDVQMPVMDGFAATAAIRDPASKVRRHDIPIVAMTAHAMKGDREHCLASGMNAYISKPFTANDLLATLASLLGNVTDTRDIFDRDVLLRYTEGEVTLARKMATCFLNDTPRRLSDLETAAQTSDKEAFHRHAHSLKSATAMLGGSRAHDICQRLEKRVRDGELESASHMIPDVKTEILSLVQALKTFLQS